LTIQKLILALLLLTSTSVFVEDCSNSKTQTDYNDCENAEYSKLDKTLNHKYQQILAKTQGQQKKLLIQAQREWIRFRDNDCEFQTYATAMGSIHPMMMAICLQAKTESRIDDLNKMLQCKEGDMSCGFAED